MTLQGANSSLDVPRARADFPICGSLAYFATGNINAPPKCVTDALCGTAREWESIGDRVYGAALDRRARLRELAAQAVGGGDGEIALVESTSAGVTLIAHLVSPAPGQNVVVDDMCIPPNVYPWFPFVSRGTELRVVEARDGILRAEDYSNLIDRKTCAVSMCLISMKTGTRTPVESVAAAAREAGAIVIADVAQAVGAIPVDVRSLGIDAAVWPAYKWTLGPAGVGYVWLGERLRGLPPPFPGRGGVVNPQDYDIGTPRFRKDAQRFEGGMFPVVLMDAASEGLQYLFGLGLDSVQTAIARTTAQVRKSLTDLGVQVATPAAAEARAGLVFFETRKRDLIARRLLDADVKVVPLLDGIRIDCGLHNDAGDIGRLLDALGSMDERLQ